jgi:hypothetical protein
LDYAAGRLDPERKAMFDELGLVWVDPDTERWERRWVAKFRELEDFKRQHGHVRVPGNKSALGKWVSHQRILYRTGQLQKERNIKLESIAFIWRLRAEAERDTTAHDEIWMEKYEELKDFQEEHGHINIRVREGSLGLWAYAQRQRFRKDELREDRKQLLYKIGFVWDIGKESKDEMWRAKFEELKAYRMEFGHSDVSYADNNALLVWIIRQRIKRKAGRLEPERKAMLEEVGMEW